jgi:hypothetical protein
MTASRGASKFFYWMSANANFCDYRIIRIRHSPTMTGEEERRGLSPPALFVLKQ